MATDMPPDVPAEQEHLLASARRLPPAAAAAFLQDVAKRPWAELLAARIAPSSTPPVLRPPRGLTWKRQIGEGGLRERLARVGGSLIAHGRVAAVLLAGGDASRLGIGGPKGLVVLGPEEDRTLYQVLVERLARARPQSGAPLPLVVLVGPRTSAATREFFAPHAAATRLLGAPALVLEQATLPTLDPEGRALLAAPGRLLEAPDGHGGLWQVLRDAGLPAAWRAAGIDVVATFQVDNPLARPLDPVLLGWMVERRAEIGTKVVRKASPAERVGVVARALDGRTMLVEYSELPTQGTDDLVLGSTAIHAFSTRFLERVLASGWLPPLHAAKKTATAIDPAAPDAPAREVDAVKYERFLFDIFPHAARVEFHEVERAHEFAPIKHAVGVDGLDSARLAVVREWLRWHEVLGRKPSGPPRLEPLLLDGEEPWNREPIRVENRL